MSTKVEIPQLHKNDLRFPDPLEAIDSGLLAWGGDLSIQRLIHAYEHGIFPWYSPNDPLLWWSPNPRLILYPQDLRVTKSLKKSIKKYEVRYNTDFKNVILACKSLRKDTWISDEMLEAYIELHKIGCAKSVEVYYENELVGGLYGVKIGALFCGESMFSTRSDASKVALWHLSQKMIQSGADFIDAQMPTEHLLSLGAVPISRTKFLEKLAISKKREVDFI